MKKFNIIDYIVIGIMILLVLFACIKFNKYNGENVENIENNTIKYTIGIKGVRNYTVDAFQVGDKVYDTETNIEIGKIINKNVQNATMYESLENGESVKIVIPDKYDIYLDIETNGTVNDNGYYANKTIELKVGSEKIIETLYAKTTGKIWSIDK